MVSGRRGEGRGGVALAERSAREVFEDHLRLAQEGAVEEDLRRNYAGDVVVLIREGVYRGHDEVRVLAERLKRELPDARFEYTAKLVEGELALLEWTAEADGARVDDGADSFLIRGGRVVGQTIHYTVHRD